MDEPASTTRRLFVAVALPDGARAHLAEAVERVRAGDPGRAPTVRWGDPATWHLTLVFCGAVAPGPELELAVGLRLAAAGQRRLRLGLARGGRFGQRVLWVGVGGDTSALLALAAAASGAARAAGIEVEDRVYRPHLTVARGRPGADLAPAAAALRDYAGPTWDVEDFVLVESRLGAGQGGTALHTAFETFGLG